MRAIERIRAALEADVKGYGNLNHTWATDEDDDGNFGLHIVGANVDGELYPALEIDTAQYFQEEDGPKLAEYYAACNPAAMSEVLAHIDALEIEIAELKNIAYSDDGAGGDGMRLYLENREMKAELEQLRKDAERLDYIEESGNFGVTRYRSGPGGPVLIEAEDGKKDISKSASSLRDAIDSVIKEAKGTL